MELSPAPRVSVTIAQHGRWELTLRAVQSVLRSSYSGEVEILVFDNGSPEGPGPIAEDARVRLLESAWNLGFGPAHNQLGQRASGELLLVLNNDVVLAPLALEHLVERWYREGGRCLVAPQYRTFEGEILEMGVGLRPGGLGMQCYRGATPPESLTRLPLGADYGSAAALLVPRDAFLAAGGFDAQFAPAYFEDTDLCLRLAQMGLPTVIEPRAKVFHLEGGTAAATGSELRTVLAARHRPRFLRRWGNSGRQAQPGPCPGLDRALDLRPGQPRLLWVHPELPRPDQAGGDARVWRELEVLRQAGWQVALWACQVTDTERYGRALEARGIAWFGPPEPRRWPSSKPSPSPATLDELVSSVPFDAIVVWSASLAARVIPCVRQYRPTVPIVLDNGVLAFLQAQRASDAGIAIDEALNTDAQSELVIYRAADGVIASSAYEREVLAGCGLEASRLHAYDVGAYPPLFGDETERAVELLFLGNFLHPPNTDAVRFWNDEIAPRVEDRMGRAVELTVVGYGSDSAAAGEEWRHVRALGWQADLGPVFHRTRVFAAPLRYGAGTKDKIAVAVGFGVPTVATTIGAEAMPPGMAPAISVADGAEPFARCVATLVGDDAEWRLARERTRSAASQAWACQSAADRALIAFLNRFRGPDSARRLDL